SPQAQCAWRCSRSPVRCVRRRTCVARLRARGISRLWIRLDERGAAFGACIRLLHSSRAGRADANPPAREHDWLASTVGDSGDILAAMSILSPEVDGLLTQQ